MRSLNIKYAFAKNFLCFGPNGVEIKFADYGKLVFVRGENRDVKSVEGSLPSDEVKISSNGSGKSSIQEIICYGLFGKTIKKPSAITKDGVINNLVGKDCVVEVIWDRYRVVRTRKKNSLRLWESESNEWNESSELTTGSMDETQATIENIIGLTYESFVSICIFADDQSISFLEAGAPLKREIVENLLSLSAFREKHDKAKKLVSETTASIKVLTREYEILKSNEEQNEKRIKQAEIRRSDWVKSKTNEVNDLKVNLDAKRSKLGKSSHGADILAYQEAQRTIQDGTKAIDDLDKVVADEKSKFDLAQDKGDKLREAAQNLRSKADQIKADVSAEQREIDSKNQHIRQLERREHGSLCDTCFGVIDESNIQKVIDEDKRIVATHQKTLNSLMQDATKLSEEMKELSEKQKKVKEFTTSKELIISKANSEIRDWRMKISEAMKVKEPKADSSELLLQQEIDMLEQSLLSKQLELDGKTPFDDIIDSEREDLKRNKDICSKKSDCIKDSEENLKHYQFWQAGFGDKGIRKVVVDGIIPQLNNRIAYWLQFLIDNKIALRFDSEFNETIERNPADGDPYIYHAMSAGQRRRLNLAVSQAFADIMMLSCGTVPSLVFLDEVTTNIDPIGVQGIYNMIQELMEDKQVFVTTHDKDLIKMLETATTMNLVHEGGFTIVKN
jgi:DNA repair exonuclease SbcCD ATPase subunit